MKIEKLKLEQIRINEENPRSITTEKMNKLVNSILSFPKMLAIRPVVLDENSIALGGNMRTNALYLIKGMTYAQISAKLDKCADYLRKSDIEKQRILAFWETWVKQPFAFAIKAEDLTEDEKEQFIIKDNVSFGQWDWDMLANNWDNDKLNDWGMDLWDTTPHDNQGESSSKTGSDPDASENDGTYNSNGDINLNSFFNPEEENKEPKEKVLICPHCGMNVYAPVEEQEGGEDDE